MKDKIIFIHIPKTGGTTINAAMNNSYWQTEPNFNYRHILKDRKSNSGDIFNPNNIDQYKEYDIFMMLRSPIDRVTSEYHFIRERKEFIDLLKNKPINFKSYIKNRQTQNGVTNFLVGRRMYDLHAANDSDLENVLEVIDELPIHVGIFEEFATSMKYFSDKTGIKWKKNIELALRFEPNHISSYALTIEPKTVLSHQVKKQQVEVLDDDEILAQFNFLMDRLENEGYEHYEKTGEGLCLVDSCNGKCKK